MKKQLRKIYKREMFNPGIIGFFTNPFFIIRRGLYKGVKENAPSLTGKLLDFGCGNKPYENLFSVEEYIGLDIEKSGQNNKSDSVDVYYDGEKIPFNDNFFDSIFSSEVFEHVFNLDEVLKEIHRVCKSNGHLLITVPLAWDEHEIPYDFGRYTSFGIKYLLEKHGFEIIRQTKSTNYITTIFQMWNSYVYQHILKHRIAKLLFVPLIISPVMLIGIILSKILPRNDNYYHNNIVLSKKMANNI